MFLWKECSREFPSLAIATIVPSGWFAVRPDMKETAPPSGASLRRIPFFIGIFCK